MFAQGGVGLVSRSGTLTYQIGAELAQLGLGNSTIVGIGGDPVVGTSFIDALELFQADDQTEIIVMVGEIGGNEEEKAADYIAEHVTKPVFSYIAGFTAPPGKTMGHAGAIISGSSGTAAAKKEALEARGVRVGTNPTEVAQLVAAGVRGWTPGARTPHRGPNAGGVRNCPLWPPRTLPPSSPSPAASRRPTCCPSPTSPPPPQRALEQDPAGALAYGDGAGYAPLRQWVATRYGDGDPARVLCTNGSLQGLALLAETLFAGSGGRAIVEAPTYDRAILILRRFGATVEPVDLQADGIDVDAIEAACRTGRVPGLVYTIPNFQNPGGMTLSRAKRERLVALRARARLPGARGRPVRRAALRGRGRAAAVRPRRGRGPRHLLDVVHEDRGAGRPHRRDGAAAGSCTPTLPQARDRHLHRADDAVARRPSRSTARRALRAQRGADAAERCAERRDALVGRRRRAPRRPRPLRRAGRRLLPVARPARASTPTRWPTRRTRPATPVVKGSTCFTDGRGRDALRLAYSACPASDMDEGIARLAALL